MSRTVKHNLGTSSGPVQHTLTCEDFSLSTGIKLQVPRNMSCVVATHAQSAHQTLEMYDLPLCKDLTTRSSSAEACSFKVHGQHPAKSAATSPRKNIFNIRLFLSAGRAGASLHSSWMAR